MMIGRRIAIDFGDKWAGIAISDNSGLIASPYKSVPAGEVLNEIKQIAEDGEVAVIYVGLPLHLSGHEGASVEKVRDFASEVASLKIAPTRLVDERLSTKSASTDKGLISSTELTHCRDRDFDIALEARGCKETFSEDL